MGSGAQCERQEERRHHPLRLRRNERRKAEKGVASGECPGFVRCLSGLAFDISSKVVRSRSAVGIAAVFDGGDAKGVTVVIEADAVVADAQPELRRFDVLEALDVAFAGFQITASACRMRRAVG
jgi:hypothetical protein